MGMRNKTCPKCQENIVKNFYSKSCSRCYQASRRKWFCVDCGEKVCSGVTRCQPCSGISQRGSSSPSWKGGLPKCIECGENLSRYDSLDVGTGYCRLCYKGEKTRRWNSELSPEERLNGRSINPDYYQWRISVFERDDYSCQECGDSRGGNLVAHHIKSYKDHIELRTDVDNGITWCERCHLKYHKENGYVQRKI